MRTAYCPKSHEQLGTACRGREYGHVPGHQYHDVDVVISRRGEKYRCHVVESWGSAQGYDEEHGRREAIGRGDSIRECVQEAKSRATAAGIENEYLVQALSAAEDKAEETQADESDTATSAGLHDYHTGAYVRPATAEELEASREAAKMDGGAGVILIDTESWQILRADDSGANEAWRCYVRED